MKLRWSRGFTIRRQLSTLVLAVALPLVGAVGYAGYTTRVNVTDSAMRTSADLATLTASNVRTFLADTRAEMIVLAARPSVRRVDGARCDPLLREALRLRRYTANVTVVDLEGRLVCSALPRPAGGSRPVADTKWFGRVRSSGRFTVGEPYLGRISNRLVAVLALPISDRGRRVGYLTEPLDLVRFQQLFARLAGPSDALISVVTTSGTFVARSRDAARYAGRRASPAIAARLDDAPAVATGVDGVERVYAIEPIKGTNWVVLAGIPTSVAYGPSNRLLTTLLLVCVGLLALALLVAIVAGRWVAAPIQALAMRARDVAEGRPSAPAPPRGPPEVTEAAQRFDEMVAALRDGEQHLRSSEERFRQGFDNAPIGMSLVDPASWRFTRVNAALCAFLGRTEEELLTLTVHDVSDPDDMRDQVQALEGFASGERSSYRADKRYVRPDGSIVWGALGVSRALNPDRSIDVLFGHVIDITERKALQASLQRQLSEVQWLTEINQAFEEDRFELHAQPMVAIATGAVVQHELLIRMRGRDGELIAPGAFLPAAEQYGTIREIDRWVISRAAEIASHGLVWAVNLSGVSLGDPTLPEHVARELARTGADPSALVLEITETALIEAGDRAVLVAEQIRGLGCRFALDDFGTGYGGFHHLKTLPLAFLKIDQEFVRDAVTVESDRHVILAVVSLAKGFGLKTVAEGVEDQATLDLLAEMDVDYAQGFHLGRPAALDARLVTALAEIAPSTT